MAKLMEEEMLDQIMDTFRKASESTLQAQQEMLKQWSQQWTVAPSMSGGASTEWTRGFQQRWLEMTVDVLNKHRESIDSTYRAGIQVIEQSVRLSEAKSSEDLRRMTEELWRKLFDTIKTQYESQFQEFHKWTERSFDLAQKAQSATSQAAQG
jgi:hypothetical protein